MEDGNKAQTGGGSHRLLKASFVITGINLLASCLGFLTNLLLAASFGAGSEMDGLFVSQTIPLWIQAVISTAANFTIIPILGELEHQGKHLDVARTSSVLITLFGICFAVGSLLCLVAGPLMVDWSAPGLSGPTRQTAIHLLAIQSPLILTFGIAALLSSIHSSRQDYFHGPSANVIGAVINFLCVLLLRKSLGIGAAAVGTVASSVAMLLLLAVPHLKEYPFRFTISWNDAVVRKILWLMGPLLMGAVFYRADNLIQRFVASSLPAGSIAYLGYAQKVLFLFVMVLSSGMPVVALSHFSASLRKSDMAGLARTFSSVFLWMTFASVGTVVFIASCGSEVIQILFMRGRFDAEATHATHQSLLLYSGVLLSGVLGGVITPVFYANKDVRTPVLLGVGGALFQTLLSFILTPALSYQALPLAYSISNLTAVGSMFVVLRYRHLKFDAVPILRFGACCAVAGWCGWLAGHFLEMHGLGSEGVWLRLLAKGTAGTLTYLVCSMLLGVISVLSLDHPVLKGIRFPTLFKAA